MLEQVYFCIGAAKTGTTILARLLDQQPGVACLWEGFLLRPDHDQSVLNTNGKSWRRHGFPRERVEDWGRRATARVPHDGREVLAMRKPAEVRSIITEVLETFAEQTDSTVVGDKWPNYYRNLKLMMRAFPSAKFVYNVRDPRGVWNSGQTFRDRAAGDKVLKNMLDVDEIVQPYLDDERFITLRYEDLIADPSGGMERLAGFLGFDFEPAALEYDPAHDPFPNRWYWIPTAKGPLDVGLTEKWRTEMTPEQQRDALDASTVFCSRYGYR